ncbi:unnamed protein product [Paramecium octaurelia]|uniref:Uncharacterized protein n=1 Tax=Paramecium octaurelia TaxID=43137 RepID=A0A8S1WML0_PAROT|nr:unnamed protein product [Paramecium octaurelia]
MMMFMASDIVVGNALIALISTIFDSKISLIRLGEAQKTQRVDLQLEQELELERGQFCKQILYNNGPINGIQLSEVMNEKITQIDRCCQSVWQYIPSGIATALTWIITGQALRHEFVIIDTTNHTCCIELVKVKNDDNKDQNL